MKVLIGIATFKRREKLKRLLNSIARQTHKDFDIMVMCDNNDVDTHLHMRVMYPEIMSRLMREHKYVIGCWNEMHKEGALLRYDAHMTLCDDVELYPDCLEKATSMLETLYPDLDGVVGLTQIYPNHEVFFQPTGQVLMGSRFVNRFAQVDYKVCCPNYIQWYQDEELLEYGTGLGRFKLCAEARLRHYHPSYYKDELDETHALVRNNFVQHHDMTIRERRKKRNLVWGKSFEVV